MTNGNQLTREEQAWLVEYQVCQQHNDASASHYWITVAIFMGINTALLGWVVSGIISNNTFLVSDNVKYSILILGLAVIAIVLLLIFWLNRVNTIIFINNYRMREIEDMLGMLKNRTVNWYDHPKTIPDEQRERLTALHKELRGLYPSPLRAATYVTLMYKIIISLWAILIVVVF